MLAGMQGTCGKRGFDRTEAKERSFAMCVSLSVPVPEVANSELYRTGSRDRARVHPISPDPKEA